MNTIEFVDDPNDSDKERELKILDHISQFISPRYVLRSESGKRMRGKKNHGNEPIQIMELPLCEDWERIAAKELSRILHGVCNGGFDSRGDLAQSIHDLAYSIEMVEWEQR